MNNYMSNASLERYRKFQDRPDVMRVALRYSDWVMTDQGIETAINFTTAAMLLLGRKLTRLQYRQLIAKEAEKTGLPLDDIKIMARTAKEVFLCTMTGPGQIT